MTYKRHSTKKLPRKTKRLFYSLLSFRPQGEIFICIRFSRFVLEVECLLVKEHQ